MATPPPELAPFAIAKDGTLGGRLDSHTCAFLSGGWLEDFLFVLLERHAAALGIHDVRLGIRPRAPDDEHPNEIDVAFMTGCTMCAVECKTGSMNHDPGLEAMYKLEAVMAQSRALLRRTWFATTSDRVYDPGDTSTPPALKPSLARRCRIYGCRIIMPHEITALATAPSVQEELALLKEIVHPSKKAPKP